MTNERALEVFARALIREILSAPDAYATVGEDVAPVNPEPEPDPPASPTPRLDFTADSDAEFEARRAAEFEQLEREIDDMAPASSPAQNRARRIRERDYPENIPMKGMAPPEEA